MILKLKRTPAIFLVGFMGCGKTTVGRMLADEIGWRFADIDEDIEMQSGLTIPQLFDTQGEPEFRRLENLALERRVDCVRSGHPMVLSLGGGALTRAENIELVENNGVSIWIDTAFDVVRKRVGSSSHRPLARDPRKFEELFYLRRATYERAEYRVTVAVDDSRAALADVLALPVFHD